MIVLRWIAGGGVALLGLVAIVRLSDVSWHSAPGDDAMLRLSWRAVGERIEECRVLSEEELAALPRHMRRPEVCEGRLAPFRLEVALDGDTLVSREVRPEGAREDRPTYVFEERPIRPGRHRLEVSFRVDADRTGPGRQPDRTLSAALDVASREVVLVTADESTGELVLAGPRR